MCQLSSLKTSPGLVSLPGSVQLLHKIMNAKTVEHAGIKISKILVIGNIDMWRHPKYYKELRKAGNELAKRDAVKENREAYSGSSLARNKSDQAISSEAGDGERERSPGPGLKQQAIDETVPHCDIEEASSSKHQASSAKFIEE